MQYLGPGTLTPNERSSGIDINAVTSGLNLLSFSIASAQISHISDI